MSEQGEAFDAARDAYDAARENLRAVIDCPDKTISVDEYKAQIRDARRAAQRAHKAMLAAHHA